MRVVLEGIKNLSMLLDKNVQRLLNGKVIPTEVTFHASVYANVMSSVYHFSPEILIVRYGNRMAEQRKWKQTVTVITRNKKHKKYKM